MQLLYVCVLVSACVFVCVLRIWLCTKIYILITVFDFLHSNVVCVYVCKMNMDDVWLCV